MTVSAREKKLLLLVVPALVVALIVRFAIPEESATAGSSGTTDIAIAEQRVARMRQLIATTPVRSNVAKQASADLAERERGLLQAATVPQAAATLLEIARRVGKANEIDVRGGDFGAPKTTGEYGLVYTTVTFECHVEQLVNFLADLSKQQELIVPSEERITSNNVKQKLMAVRMVLAGVTAKSLIPEKKGLGAL